MVKDLTKLVVQRAHSRVSRSLEAKGLCVETKHGFRKSHSPTEISKCCDCLVDELPLKTRSGFVMLIPESLDS